MAVTPFRAVNFQPDQLLTEELLDQLASNENYLYEMTPRAQYTYDGINTQSGIKLMSGRTLIAATKENHQATTVGFGNFFSSGSNPNVAVATVSNHSRRFFVTIEGWGHTLAIDNRGFNVFVYLDAQTKKKNDKIPRSFYISWIAMGY